SAYRERKGGVDTIADDDQVERIASALAVLVGHAARHCFQSLPQLLDGQVLDLGWRIEVVKIDTLHRVLVSRDLGDEPETPILARRQQADVDELQAAVPVRIYEPRCKRMRRHVAAYTLLFEDRVAAGVA